MVMALGLLLVSAVTVYGDDDLPYPDLPADQFPNKQFDPPFPIGKQAAAASPYLSFRVHNNGRFWNTVMNNGVIGNLYNFPDPLARRTAPAFFFPKYSRRRHGFYTGLWVGGVVGDDTLVTCTIDELGNTEMWPGDYPDGDFVEVERDSNGVLLDAGARQQMVAQYADTLYREAFVPFSPYDLRKHQPLNIAVTQTTYSWSLDYAEDFIIADYAIKNVGRQAIQDAYVGIYYVGGVQHISEQPFPRLDDIEGFIDSLPHEFEEAGYENIDLAWVIDNDGQPLGSSWGMFPTQSGFGVAPLRVPDSGQQVRFNWWINTNYAGSWGPRRKGLLLDEPRMFPGGLGTPYGDKAKYHIMSFPEIDYSGYEAALNFTAQGWLPPHPSYARIIAQGHFVNFVSSFGTFDLLPGEEKHFTVVYTVGDEIHTIPTYYRNNYSFFSPYKFINYLQFDDMLTNYRWAKRIFDNPGVDTDGNGDSGKYFFRIDEVTGDTNQVFYTGDGVPDFKGALPPPPPELRVRTEEGVIYVRWNGEVTERFLDTFSGIVDFEGYRVYIGRSRNEGDISMVASWDQENYYRWTWNDRRERYELIDLPYTIEDLRQMYGESFDPLNHPYHNPLYASDGIYYFSAVDFNLSERNSENGIYKVYPDAPLDTSVVDEEGRLLYYEYEIRIDSLLPTVPYYVAVTGFDFGHPPKNLSPLESSPFENLTKVFAVDQQDEFMPDSQLNVYVYPNPWRIDGDYMGRGFENRFDDLAADRARTIYFANLPNKCKISIFSLDGDLVKEFWHDEPKDSPTASVARFDMISRNTQAVVSGLYYWVVESEYGNQIGKLMIIK